MRGECFSVFSMCFLSHPRSRENPIKLCEDEDPCLFVEVGLAGVARVRDSSCVYEAWGCAVAALKESVCLLRW